MRIINADTLRERCAANAEGWFCHREITMAEASKMLCELIEDAPTIDAEPVVRCKDCKHRGDPKECYMCFTEVEDIEGGRMYKFTDMTRSDGFCHKGAKMDAKEEDE